MARLRRANRRRITVRSNTVSYAAPNHARHLATLSVIAYAGDRASEGHVAKYNMMRFVSGISL